jgi:hypothetical protein
VVKTKTTLSEDGRHWILESENRFNLVRRVAGAALINTPIPPEWEAYVTQTPGKLEVVPDQLWDALTYVDNTTVNLEYFNDVRANRGLSNMTQPGFLPNPESFLIEAVRLYYRTEIETVDQGAAGSLASAANDIALLQNSGRLKFTIGNKNYGPWRLWTMPANAGIALDVGVAGAEAANLVTQYATTMGREWALFPHLMVSPMQNFSAQMEWPAAVNTSANIIVEVLLDGKRARAVQ